MLISEHGKILTEYYPRMQQAKRASDSMFLLEQLSHRYAVIPPAVICVGYIIKDLDVGLITPHVPCCADEVYCAAARSGGDLAHAVMHIANSMCIENEIRHSLLSHVLVYGNVPDFASVPWKEIHAALLQRRGIIVTPLFHKDASNIIVSWGVHKIFNLVALKPCIPRVDFEKN